MNKNYPVPQTKKMISITQSEYEKYGCIQCGCTFAHLLSTCDASLVTCGECQTPFILLADVLRESPIRFGKVNCQSSLIQHPRKGLWPHDFVRPDIRPKGIDGEFWSSNNRESLSPRIGYELSGLVMSKEAGERIVQMVRDIIGKDFQSWLDYRLDEPLWIQVKIRKEDGFDLKALAKACEDGVINRDRLISCCLNTDIFVPKTEITLVKSNDTDRRLEVSMHDMVTNTDSWIKSKLKDAGFDLCKDIPSQRDLESNNYIYTQRVINPVNTDMIKEKDTCVCCGDYVPEGHQTCFNCDDARKRY